MGQTLTKSQLLCPESTILKKNLFVCIHGSGRFIYFCILWCSIQHAVQEAGKMDCMLKSESVQTATATELQDEWKLSTEGMD